MKKLVRRMPELPDPALHLDVYSILLSTLHPEHFSFISFETAIFITKIA